MRGSMSNVSATSSMIARLITVSPAANPASNALSQRLLMLRGMPSEQRRDVVDRRRREDVGTFRAGNQQARNDVAISLFNVRQRFNHATQGNALFELAQIRIVEHFAQFGLARQNDLQLFRRVRLEIESSRISSRTCGTSLALRRRSAPCAVRASGATRARPNSSNNSDFVSHFCTSSNVATCW